jgi:hypothetical protein
VRPAQKGESCKGGTGRGWRRTPPPSAPAQWDPFGFLPQLVELRQELNG